MTHTTNYNLNKPSVFDKVLVSDLNDNADIIDGALAGKIDMPSGGTSGQHLVSDGEGGASWGDVGLPTDAQVGEAVSDWLDDHPEATTTVEDGSITYAKLDSNLKGKADSIEQLSDAVDDIIGTTRNIFAGDTLAGFINTSTETINENDNAVLVYAPCESGKTYTVSKMAGARFIVGTTAALPAVGVSVLSPVSDNTNVQLSVTAPTTATYIVAFVYLSTADTVTAEEMLASVQIEEGSSATDHVPHYTAVDVVARESMTSVKVVNCGTISALPTTVSVTGITSEYKAISVELGTPSAMTSVLVVTTGDGTITLSGTMGSGSTTTCELTLIRINESVEVSE